MKSLTICMPYYCNEGMLEEQLKRFRALPAAVKEKLELIVVDDGTGEACFTPDGQPTDRACSQAIPAWLEDIGFPYRLFKILVDVRWNQDAARNIAAREAKSDWLLLTDIDHIAPVSTLEEILPLNLDGQYVYRFSRRTMEKGGASSPYKPHPNSWLMTKKVYWKLGGYDESLAGKYGTDADFRDRVVAVTGHPNMLVQPLLRVPRDVIPDASTTTYERKAPEDAVLRDMVKLRNARPGWAPVHFRFPFKEVLS